MHRIAVIGTGYVGLVTGTCFAELGNDVTCIDIDAEKVAMLADGRIPFFEPGIEELVRRNQRDGRLRFTSDASEGLRGRDLVFIAVGTPMRPDGTADLQYVRAAAKDIAMTIDCDKIVINKSTVPVETGDLVATIIREHKCANYEVVVISNPEFLREGSAIADFMQPDRVVIGTSDAATMETMRDLYAPLGARIIFTDVRTAEMIKYTANAFLATKISFINEIANICESVGADIKLVATGVGSDKRIGPAFLNAGLGFGGSCFPKDVTALSCIASAAACDVPILEAILQVNANQIQRVSDRIAAALNGLNGRRIGVLGLAFKPNTDDVRESPAIRLIRTLLEQGAIIATHDPVAISTARSILGETVSYAHSSYEAMYNADAIVIATDWNEYKQISFEVVRKLMNGRVVFDARNIYDSSAIVEAGLDYYGIGRKTRTHDHRQRLADVAL